LRQRTLVQLKERGFVRDGDLVVIVSDLRPQSGQSGGATGSMDGTGAGERNIRSVQVRHVR
jgi:hypothetical protein